MAALTTLAALTKASTEPGLLDVMAEQLEDMHPRALELAFTALNRDWDKAGTLPTPHEIRQLGETLHASERRRALERRLAAEQRALQRRRAEHPEEFFGLADLLQEARTALVPMATADVEQRRAQLQRQKTEILARQERMDGR